MSDIETLRHIVAEIIPFNHTLDISLRSVSPDRVEMVQPESTERFNYVGEAHVSSSVLFVLAEASIVAMVLHAVHDLKDEGVVPFVVESSITYQRPTRGQLSSVATLSLEEQTRIRDEVMHTGRTRFPISAQIFDENGLLVAELRAKWGLRRPKAKA
ncbi:MAG: hypothetical protein NVSMB38_07520 [Ktedonobacteraceae bacterium]